VLQHREYRPVGGSQTRTCDVRFVAATNRDLPDAVAKGRFRSDLFYRINVVEVHLPALRERKEDLDLLVEHFFRAALDVCGRTDLVGFGPEALDELRAHDWPGNIRELENVIHRAVLLSAGPTIGSTDVRCHIDVTPPGAEIVPVLPDDGVDLRAAVRAYERSLVLQALERTQWNRSRAAELLGLRRTTLLDMIRRMALSE
jgi:DNA-binding NtrC family response regulator